MHEYIDNLTNRLLEKNDQLSYAEARTWVELLWEDFEATYAKAGHKYRGKDMTAKVLQQWIDNYGGKLHEVLKNNPRYQKLFDQKKFYH